MLETPGGYGCDFGTKLVSVGKRMPVIFKNKSKPGKLNHSNFLNGRSIFFVMTALSALRSAER
jgi:hypothetical protein